MNDASIYGPAHINCTARDCFYIAVSLTDSDNEMPHFQSWTRGRAFERITTCPIGDAEGKRIFGDPDREFGTTGRLRY